VHAELWRLPGHQWRAFQWQVGGASSTLPDAQGDSALALASARGHTAVVQLLLTYSVCVWCPLLQCLHVPARALRAYTYLLVRTRTCARGLLLLLERTRAESGVAAYQHAY
jgi:ankyrin repeat protein